MSKNYEIKCAICGEQTHYKRWSDFNRYHIHKIHNLVINDQEYFDKYVREEKEGFCVMCGKPTRFNGFFQRYSRYCSNQCTNDDPKIREIQIQKRKDFFENISDEKRDLRNNKLKEIWDSRTDEQVKQMIDKGKSTKKERYGDENYNNYEKIKENMENRTEEDWLKIINKIKKHIGSRTEEEKQIIQQKIRDTFNKKSQDEIDEYIKKSKTTKFINTQKRINEILKNEVVKIIGYDYDKNNPSYILFCEKCGKESKITYPNLNSRIEDNVEICTNCNPINSAISNAEKQVTNFIKENYNEEILENKRKIIKRYELDIYLPNLNLAIEYNGLYWHSSDCKTNNYHKDKTNKCENQNIHLIHIYEDDWMFKKEIVKSNILKILNKCEKVDSNNFKISKVDYSTSLTFLKENSLYDFKDFDVSIGLYDKDKLVYIMCFKKLSSNNYKLVDCCDIKFLQVENGLGNVLNYFIKNYDIKEIEYFADRSWVNKNFSKYLEYGFKLDLVIKEDYKYIFKTIRLNKNDKTTKDILKERDLLKIYDSGQLKFVYKN